MKTKLVSIFIVMSFFVIIGSILPVGATPITGSPEITSAPESLSLGIVHGGIFDPIYMGESAEIKVKCIDQNEDLVYFALQWGDTAAEEIVGPFAQGVWHFFTHEYAEKGNYLFKFRAIDDPNGDGSYEDGTWSEWSTSITIHVKDGRAPLQPEIIEQEDPQLTAMVGEPVTFTAVLHDFLDRLLVVRWDFGDEVSDWLKSYSSNQTITKEHIFTQPGMYEVQVQSAERISIFGRPGVPSPWSESLSIQVHANDETGVLALSTTSSVIETETFVVTVSVNGEVAPGVLVSFNQQDILTSDQGIVTFTAPSVDEDTTFTISATFEGYSSAYDQILVVNTQAITIQATNPSEEQWSGQHTIAWTIHSSNQLNAHAVLVQYQLEGEPWKTLVSDLDPYQPYTFDTVQIENGGPYFFRIILLEDTDQDGVYETFIDQDTTTNGVFIDNEQVNTGWIIGNVRNQQGAILQKAKVCVILSEKQLYNAQKCVITDSQGQFSIQITEGTYTVQASKLGYQPQTLTSTVLKNTGTLIDFTLKSISSTPQSSDADVAVSYAVSELIDEGRVGALLSFSSKTTSPIIERYSTLAVNISSLSSEEITVMVSDDDSASSTIVTMFIADDVFENNQFRVSYDGNQIPQMSLTEFLHPTNLSEPMYATVSVSDGEYVLFFIPHFSVHTITLSKIVEALTTPLALMIYAVTAGVMIALTVLPILSIERRRKR